VTRIKAPAGESRTAPGSEPAPRLIARPGSRRFNVTRLDAVVPRRLHRCPDRRRDPRHERTHERLFDVVERSICGA
jgi:hypothetical protein